MQANLKMNAQELSKVSVIQSVVMRNLTQVAAAKSEALTLQIGSTNILECLQDNILTHIVYLYTHIQSEVPMWKRQFQKHYLGIKRKDVWKLMTDVNNWPKWHCDLYYCQMNGSFEVGNHFILKPKGVKPIKIMLTDIKDGHQFTDCTSFPGAKMYDTHTIEETPDGLLLSNTLIVTGQLKWPWIKLVAQNVADTVPNEMESLVDLISRWREIKKPELCSLLGFSGRMSYQLS